MKINFIVPMTPPSVNSYVRHTRAGRHYKTSLAGTFEQAVAVFANGQTLIPAESSLLKKIRYGIDLTIVLDKKQRLDLDNAAKCAIDALVTCGVIHSDAAVVRLVMTKYRDLGNPRTEFVVSTI